MKVQVLFWSSEDSWFSPLFAASHRNTGLYLLDGDQRRFPPGIVNTDLDLASFPVFLEWCFSTQSMILICDCCSSVRVHRGGVRLPDATRLCAPLTWKPPQPPERRALQPQPRRHLRVTQDPPRTTTDGVCYRLTALRSWVAMTAFEKQEDFVMVAVRLMSWWESSLCCWKKEREENTSQQTYFSLVVEASARRCRWTLFLSCK